MLLEEDAPTAAAESLPRALVVVGSSTVERGRGPRPGPYARPFVWENVTEAPPPRRRSRGEGAFALVDCAEVDADARITYSTVVAIDPSRDVLDPAFDVLRVDTRVAVERRTLLALMDRERAFTERVTARWRQRHLWRLVRHGRVVARIEHARARRAAIRLVRFEARAGASLISGTRRLLRGLVGVPDAAVSALYRAQAHVTGRGGRQNLLNGLKDPSRLDTEQKSVLLFMSAIGLFVLVLLLNTLFALVLPRHAATYRHVFGDATMSLLGTVGLPLAMEPLLVLSALAVGPAAAFVGLFAGKIVGAWLVYLLGDALHDELAAEARATRTRRVVQWMRRRTERHGFAILATMNAIPFVPDATLYVFALTGMKFKHFLGGVAAGTAIKFGGIAIGVLLVGPERITGLLDAPLWWR